MYVKCSYWTYWVIAQMRTYCPSETLYNEISPKKRKYCPKEMSLKWNGSEAEVKKLFFVNTLTSSSSVSLGWAHLLVFRVLPRPQFRPHFRFRLVILSGTFGVPLLGRSFRLRLRSGRNRSLPFRNWSLFPRLVRGFGRLRDVARFQLRFKRFVLSFEKDFCCRFWTTGGARFHYYYFTQSQCHEQILA